MMARVFSITSLMMPIAHSVRVNGEPSTLTRKESFFLSRLTVYGLRLNKFQAAEEVGQLDLSVLFGVGAVDGVLADGVGELFAERALVGLGRVGRAHQVAPGFD